MKKIHAQNLIEYALILALITIISFTILSHISKMMGTMFDNKGAKTQTIQTNVP